jgi:hypothetical protein
VPVLGDDPAAPAGLRLREGMLHKFIERKCVWMFSLWQVLPGQGQNHPRLHPLPVIKPPPVHEPVKRLRVLPARRLLSPIPLPVGHPLQPAASIQPPNQPATRLIALTLLEPLRQAVHPGLRGPQQPKKHRIRECRGADAVESQTGEGDGAVWRSQGIAVGEAGHAHEEDVE